jgi:hypothetical protein
MVPVSPPPEPEKAEMEESEEAESPEPTETEAWVLPDGNQADKSQLDSVISALADLRCDEFLEQQNPDDLENPLYTVIVTGGKDYKLQIFTKQEGDAGKYPAISSENPFPFLLSTYRAEQIMKKPEDLIKKDEEES